jgi:hypothetical protein
MPSKDDDYLPRSELIADAVDGNPEFPDAAVQVAAVKDAIVPYARAHADAKAKMPGAARIRQEARKALAGALDHLRDAVQTVIDAHVDRAAALAESAKMRLRKPYVRTKADFAVDDGLLPGSVNLLARAVAGALLYYWEVSQNGTSWSVAAETCKASAALTGLTPGQTYDFRFRARTRKDGYLDYSQVIRFMVR